MRANDWQLRELAPSGARGCWSAAGPPAPHTHLCSPHPTSGRSAMSIVSKPKNWERIVTTNLKRISHWKSRCPPSGSWKVTTIADGGPSSVGATRTLAHCIMPLLTEFAGQNACVPIDMPLLTELSESLPRWFGCAGDPCKLQGPPPRSMRRSRCPKSQAPPPRPVHSHSARGLLSLPTSPRATNQRFF